MLLLAILLMLVQKRRDRLGVPEALRPSHFLELMLSGGVGALRVDAKHQAVAASACPATGSEGLLMPELAHDDLVRKLYGLFEAQAQRQAADDAAQLGMSSTSR